jgi:hypothetical protein
MAGGALPMQLQHLLKEANIPVASHQACIKQRAMGQMKEYLKLANIRTMRAAPEEESDTLSQLIAFAHDSAGEPAAGDPDDEG